MTQKELAVTQCAEPSRQVGIVLHTRRRSYQDFPRTKSELGQSVEAIMHENSMVFNLVIKKSKAKEVT